MQQIFPNYVRKGTPIEDLTFQILQEKDYHPWILKPHERLQPQNLDFHLVPKSFYPLLHAQPWCNKSASTNKPGIQASNLTPLY